MHTSMSTMCMFSQTSHTYVRCRIKTHFDKTICIWICRGDHAALCDKKTPSRFNQIFNWDGMATEWQIQNETRNNYFPLLASMMFFLSSSDCTSKLDLNGGRLCCASLVVPLALFRCTHFSHSFPSAAKMNFRVFLCFTYLFFCLFVRWLSYSSVSTACERLINVIIAYEWDTAQKYIVPKLRFLCTLSSTSTYNPICWMNEWDLSESALAF